MNCEMCGTESKKLIQTFLLQDQYEGVWVSLCESCINRLQKRDTVFLNRLKESLATHNPKGKPV
jgi:ribosome-binding protein aMBF1 (putative translation factor)